MELKRRSGHCRPTDGGGKSAPGKQCRFCEGRQWPERPCSLHRYVVVLLELVPSEETWKDLLRDVCKISFAVSEIALPRLRIPDLDAGIGTDDHALLRQ